MNNFRYFLSAFAAAQLFIAQTAVAGMPEAAGTVVSEDGLGKSEFAIIAGLAVVAVAVVVYLKRRKSQ